MPLLDFSPFLGNPANFSSLETVTLQMNCEERPIRQGAQDPTMVDGGLGRETFRFPSQQRFAFPMWGQVVSWRIGTSLADSDHR